MNYFVLDDDEHLSGCCACRHVLLHTERCSIGGFRVNLNRGHCDLFSPAGGDMKATDIVVSSYRETAIQHANFLARNYTIATGQEQPVDGDITIPVKYLRWLLMETFLHAVKHALEDNDKTSNKEGQGENIEGAV